MDDMHRLVVPGFAAIGGDAVVQRAYGNGDEADGAGGVGALRDAGTMLGYCSRV